MHLSGTVFLAKKCLKKAANVMQFPGKYPAKKSRRMIVGQIVGKCHANILQMRIVNKCKYPANTTIFLVFLNPAIIRQISGK